MVSLSTSKILRTFLVATALFPLAAHAQFTSGNVVVLQVGLGTSALTNASTPIVLKEFTTSTANQTTPVKTVIIDTSGSARLTIGGTAPSEGQMTLSSDSFKLVIAGYDAPPNTASINSTASASVPRAIDTLSLFAVPGRADTTKTAFSTVSIRSATRNSGETYWASGGSSGIYYMGNTSSPATVYNATTNLRVVIAQNGRLYFSTQSGLPRIGRINSQPTSGITSADTMINLGASATPNGFAINPAETIAYVADERTTGGGIQKWVLSGGVWTNVYTFTTTGFPVARSVIVDWSGAYPIIYAIVYANTTAGGSLIKIIDTNSTVGFITLATAPANTAFRGVAFSPRACATPALTFGTTAVYCTSNGSVSLTTTGGTGPFSFAYNGPGSFSAATQNISNLVAGTYRVTVTSAGGCSRTDSVIVIDSAFLPQIAVSYTGSLSRCQGDSILFTAGAGTGYHYQWTLNGSPLTNDTLRTYKAGAPGIYNVQVTYGTCFRTNAGITLTINPLPNTTVSASGSTTFCTGGSVRLCAFSSSTNTYQWYRNGMIIPGATTSCDTAFTSGVYKVYETTSAGCLDSSMGTTVSSGTPPTATISPSGTVAICQGDSVTLHTTSIPGLTYSWLQNGVLITGPHTTDSTLKVGAGATYRAIIRAAANCIDTSRPDTVVVNPRPAVYTAWLSRDTICAGDSIRLRASGGSAQYSFLLNGTIYKTGTDSNLSFITSTAISAYSVYSFQAVITTTAGCSDSTAIFSTAVGPLPVPAVIAANGTILDAGVFSAYQWYRNDTLIPGASGRYYTATANGDYKVRVSNIAGCAAVSESYTVSGLSVGSLAGAGIRIYPNPVREVLYITSPVRISVMLHDLSGRIVAEQNDAKELLLKDFADGVYILSVYGADGSLIGRQTVTKAPR